ncbi:unnamed protein product [Malus baccata var. baccata]|uniref:GINS subunit domain-containing protein n=1 Tax=Malus domestica TaxID=3750 RepID=A0A498HLQ7_MALDO|nr:hypothetical protein DVH24_025360 [Malus domestica]
MDSGLESGSTEDYETDVKLLKSAWRQEKATPEVLQFESALIRRIIEQIQLMEETVEEFTESGIDPLTVSLYQMDLDRTQFLLRSYYRIRLQKVAILTVCFFACFSVIERRAFTMFHDKFIKRKLNPSNFLLQIEKYMFHIRDNAESRLYDKEKLFVEQRGLQLSHF